MDKFIFSLFLILLWGPSTSQGQDHSIELFSVTSPWDRTGSDKSKGFLFTASKSGDEITIFWCRKDAYLSHSVNCSPSDIKESATFSSVDFAKALGTENSEAASKLIAAIADNKLLLRLYESNDLRKFVKDHPLFFNPEEFFEKWLYDHYKKFNDEKVLLIGKCQARPSLNVYSETQISYYGHQGKYQNTSYVKKEKLLFFLEKQGQRVATLDYDKLGGKKESFQKIQEFCFDTSIDTQTPHMATSDKPREAIKTQKNTSSRVIDKTKKVKTN